MTGSPPRTTGRKPSVEETKAALAASRVVAILRAPTSEHFPAASTVLVREGIQVIEVTLTSAGALAAIRDIRHAAPSHVLVGAGSVLSAVQAEEAVEAGARCLVSSATVPDVLEAGRRLVVPVVPGALSPSEVWSAHAAGVAAVKLFPASAVGPHYIRDLRGPMPDIDILPTGGINLDDVGAWLDAGAVAVGLGDPLLGDALVGGSLEDLAARARRAVAAAHGAGGAR